MHYVDLAQLHIRLGQSQAAKRAFSIALNLAPTSRYVARAASRFFVHIGDFAAGIQVLDRCDPGDPWIQSARVSLHNIADASVRNIKKIRALLDADIDPRYLSELAGALATLEYGEGNVSRAKKLFRQGSIDPNDNMVAQLQWASQQKILAFAPEMLQKSFAYEARASFSKKEKKWKDAVSHCFEWSQDEPYSVRPATLGSFVAAELLHDFKTSLEFCQLGLIANPADFSLLNNSAYSHAALGEFSQAREFLLKAEQRAVGRYQLTVVEATKGMVRFREGNIANAEVAYSKALEEAHAQKDARLSQMIAIHYFAEYARIGNFLSSEETSEVRKIMEGGKLVNDASDLYNSLLKPFLLTDTREQVALKKAEPIIGKLLIE